MLRFKIEIENVSFIKNLPNVLILIYEKYSHCLDFLRTGKNYACRVGCGDTSTQVFNLLNLFFFGGGVPFHLLHA